MRRLALVCGVLSLALCGTASALPTPTEKALSVAQAAWGPCEDGPVTVERAELPSMWFAVSTMVTSINARHTTTCTDGIPDDNVITVTTRKDSVPLDWGLYCTVIVHEDAHLHGVGHARPNTLSIMAPIPAYDWRPCYPRSAWKRERGSLTTDKSVPGRPDHSIPRPDYG